MVTLLFLANDTEFKNKYTRMSDRLWDACNQKKLMTKPVGLLML